jgi:hypothetical protein
MNFQQAIEKVDTLIVSVNSSLSTSDAAVAIFSSTKKNSIYHLSQIIFNSSQFYSSDSDNNNSIAGITTDSTSIDQLSDDQIFTSFFLPLSLFHYAQ